MLLHDFLIESARRTPDKVALVSEGQRWSYAELEARSDALAHFLRRRGVARGDRVALFLDNTVEAVVAFWAALKAEGVVTIFNPQTKADKLAYLLDDCEPAALLAQAWHAPVFEPVVAGAKSLKVIVVARVKDAAGLSESRGVVSWEAAAAKGHPTGPPPRRSIDLDLAAIIYTSGSTGEPKGVMLSHLNMLTATRSITSYLGNTANDVILCALPFSFDYGLYQMIMAFAAGGRLVLEKSFAYSAEMLRLMVNEGVTGFPGVPTMFALIEDLKHLPSYDFSRVRYVTNTAAALSPRLLFRLRQIFPASRVFSMYGLTECKRCSYLPPEEIDRRPTSVGVAIPNTELWVVDEHGTKLGPNAVGQLVVRGATVMQGYWRKPEATARRLRPGPGPGEQVLYTGDLCRFDEGGFLYFVGRMDDIIKSRGEKVAPREVEHALLAIPGVREAAVVGVPDPLLGQAVVAFVVLASGASLTATTMRRECQKRLENFMVPSHINIVSALPRNENGKVDRMALVPAPAGAS
jgi:amino acid adenylation domain-containing protein